MSHRLALLTAALLAAPWAHAAGPNGFDLVPFVPDSISADGKTVAGEDYDADSLWTWSAAGGQVYIGGVTGLNPGAGIPVVSGDGSRIAGAYVDPASGVRRPSYYSTATGQWTMLGGLGGVSGGSFSATGTVWAMSSNGNYIAGYSLDGSLSYPNNVRGAIWNVATGTVTNLGSSGLSGANGLTRVNGISDDGRVAGGRGANILPLVWTDFDGDGSYSMVNINTVSSATVNVVNAISANGVWAVGAGSYLTDDGASYRFNTHTNTLEMLPKLGADGIGDYATAVSADGSVIVGYEDTGFGEPTNRRGFIWTANGGMQSLDSYLAGFGIDTGNSFNFVTPTGISADGRTITGFGYNKASIGQGFVVSIPVPEPSTYAMLGMGLAVLGWLGRRRQRGA